MDYLAPGDARGSGNCDDALLLGALAASPEARLREALISLFLLDPALSRLVPELRAKLDARARLELEAHFLAAVYLQEMWWYRLRCELPELMKLPDDLCRELKLPDRGELHGKLGLHALAEWHAERSCKPVNHLSGYLGAVDLLLESLERRRHREAER